MAVTLPFVLSGCAVADRTLGMVSELSSDALEFLEREKATAASSPPKPEPGKAKAPAGRQSVTLPLPAPKVETPDGHSVSWNLGSYMVADLPQSSIREEATAASTEPIEAAPEDVILPAAGGAEYLASEIVARPNPASRPAEAGNGAAAGGDRAWRKDRWMVWSDELPPPLASDSITASDSPTESDSPTVSDSVAASDRVTVGDSVTAGDSVIDRLTLDFVAEQGELSERDKVQLSMLVWPLLDDETAKVQVHAFLPRQAGQGGAAAISPLRRGTNVRAYLTHLGLPRERIAFRVLTDPDPRKRPERVEVVVEQPESESTGSLASREIGVPGQFKESDKARAEGLAAFHQRLKSFAEDLDIGSPEPVKETQKPKQKAAEPKVPILDPDDDRRQKVEAKPDLPGRLSVQLASLPDPEQARAEWSRLKAAFPELLKAMSPILQQVELEGRGEFHRVRTGSFAKHEAASALCRKLHKRGQDCLVVLNRQTADSKPTSGSSSSG